VERPVDLIGFVVDDELSEQEVKLGRELGCERRGDFSE
jgi:hypothetical protein